VAKQAFLVDDSKSARIVLSRMLKKCGFDSVEMAVSGEEALERLKGGITPDAFFVDFLMDGMDGLETITEIKKDPRFFEIPAVMCTANEGGEYVQAAVEHGALGILTKPPTEESLGEIIDMIERHQQEVAASMAAKAASAEPEAIADSGTVQAAQPSVPQNLLSDEDVRRIAEEVAIQSAGQIARQTAEEVANQSAEQIARQTAEKVVEATVAERVDTTLHAYLDEKLESMVSALLQKSLQSVEPPTPVDSESIRNSVVQQVNQDLEDIIRQLNKRTLEGLIEASVYGQVTELGDDLSQRLLDLEA